MNNKKLFTFKIIACILLFCFALCSCTKKDSDSKSNQKKNQSSENSEKVPEQLTGMEESLEKIIKELGGPASDMEEKQQSGSSEEQVQDKESSESKKQSRNKEQSQGQQSEGQQQGQSQQGQGQQQGQQQGQHQGQQQEQQNQTQDIWTKIKPLITKLNFQWNDYQPMAVKMGANKQIVDNFSSSLNNLTTVVESKNNTNALISASNLFGILADFYSLYKPDENSAAQLKRVKHYIRNAVVSAKSNNWTQTDEDIKNLISTWSVAKNDIQNDQQEQMNKLDYSILELEKVAKEKNQQLTELKGTIALSNIDSIEKQLKQTEGSSKKNK